MTTTNNPFLDLLLGDLAKLGITTPPQPGVSAESAPTPTPGSSVPPPPGAGGRGGVPTPTAAERRKEQQTAGVGTIKGPSFAGEYDANVVPPGFDSLLPYGQPGYFYNPDTGEVGLIKATADGSASWSTLSVAEAKRFLGNLQGTPADPALLQRVMGEGPSGAGGGGGGGAGDAYAGAANARANTQLAESIRARRIAEVQNAMDAIDARTQAATKARLAASEYAIDPAAKYFPGFGPQDPLARTGLISPVAPVPIGINTSAQAPSSDQVAADLARIRQLAGVGS